MKKLSAILVGMSLVAGAVMAAEPVTSVNVVGYQKYSAATGSLSLVRCDFLPVGSGVMNVSNVLGNTLPVGTQLYFWNGSGCQIDTYSSADSGPPFFTLSTNWSVGTNELKPGSAFWVRLPASAPQSAYDFVIAGEVPGNARQPSNSVPVAPGLNMIGYSYPVDTVWTNTSLSKQAVVGDRLYVWNGSGYGVHNYQVSDSGPPFFTLSTNWSDLNLVLKTGEGFWYSREASASGIIWNESAPYSLP